MGDNSAKQACFKNEVECTTRPYISDTPYEVKLNPRVALPTDPTLGRINFVAASHDNSYIGRMENLEEETTCFGYPAGFKQVVCSGRGKCSKQVCIFFIIVQNFS